MQKNEEILKRFEKVNSEKIRLNKDIDELRVMSQKLQIDVGKVNEEKTLLSAIVKNTQEENKVLSKELLAGVLLTAMGAGAGSLLVMQGSKVLVKRVALRQFQKIITLLAGKVTVTPDDKTLKPATFGKGDFVTFPAGMSCTWDVSETVEKHFMFF